MAHLNRVKLLLLLLLEPNSLLCNQPDCSGVEGEKGFLEEEVQRKVFSREGRERQVAPLSSPVTSWRTSPGREAGSWPSSLSRSPIEVGGDRASEVAEEESFGKDAEERIGEEILGEVRFDSGETMSGETRSG